MTGINNFNIYGGNEAAEAGYASPAYITKAAVSGLKKFRQTHEI